MPVYGSCSPRIATGGPPLLHPHPHLLPHLLPQSFREMTVALSSSFQNDRGFVKRTPVFPPGTSENSGCRDVWPVRVLLLDERQHTPPMDVTCNARLSLPLLFLVSPSRGISGILLTIAMFGSILSVTYLGQGIGNSVVQSKIVIRCVRQYSSSSRVHSVAFCVITDPRFSMVVSPSSHRRFTPLHAGLFSFHIDLGGDSGLWGILWYKEIVGRRTVAGWFASALLAVSGIVWLSHERLMATTESDASSETDATAHHRALRQLLPLLSLVGGG